MSGDVRQQEISKDLDHYISAKRKGGGLFGMFNKKDDEEVATHPGVKPYDDEPAVTTSVVTEAPADAAAVDAAQPKKGFFSRWFGESSEQATDVAAATESVPADDADLREVARISLGFLRQTDASALAKIKSSPDFEKFKEILRKRNIIK